jgi:predicted RNA-binding protein YlxR (DUF448 family)
MLERVTDAGTGRGPKQRSVRTCVACRRSAGARELLRVTRAPDGGLVLDWRRNLGGRGAHVCPTRACIEKAIRRRGFDRSFEPRVRYPQAEELIDTAIAAARRQIETLIRAAASDRSLVIGAENGLRALEGGDATGLIVAVDSRSSDRLVRRAAAVGVPCRIYSDKSELGAITGRQSTGALGLCNDGLGQALGELIDRLGALRGSTPKDDTGTTEGGAA